jgi:hypothetical protein
MFLDRHLDKWTPEPNTGCWIWTGSIKGARDPRPELRMGSRTATKLVARLICEEAFGPPPTLRHQAAHAPQGCIGGLCVAPHHLRWATQTENQQDIPAKKRSDRIRKGWVFRNGFLYDLPRYVTYNKHKQQYMVRCHKKFVGYYDTIDEAIIARNKYMQGAI